MDIMPDKLTGQDRIVQENYEFGLERDMVNKMDRVDRRDKRDEILTSAATDAYRRGYDLIDWGK